MALGQITPTTPILEQTFVALDLETTGTAAERDKIIQVGAVKFRGEQILDRFDTFINPGRAIPEFIQRLTGIRPDQVSRAPYFSSISQEIETFLEGHPVVGHNINFDLSFLESHGLTVHNPRYDTWDLASFLLPRPDVGYSLGALAQQFQLAHDQAHQAIDDAAAAQQLFVALLRKAEELDPALFAYIHALAVRSNWAVANLLAGLEPAGRPAPADGAGKVFRPSGLDSSILAARLGRPERRRQDEGLLQLTEAQITGLMQPGGTFAQAFPGFEERPGQVDMLEAVTEAVYQGRKLIMEGGTGVGKSMAYLLPAALYAVSRGVRVVISTNTINLQEQLMQKDIPALIEVLEGSGVMEKGLLKAAQLKGRSNYLCLRRWNYLAQSDNLSLDEARLLSKTAVWLQDTEQADKSEINLSGRDASTWSKVSAGDKGGCPASRGGGAACFLRSARERADQAHIVVVNHALLLSDLAHGGNIIPDYQHLIIDEAHNLEEAATSQFSFALTQEQLGEETEPLTRLLRQVRLALNTLDSAPAVRQDGESKLAVLEQELPRLRQNWGDTWAAIQIFFNAQRRSIDNFLITSSSRSQRSWKDTVDAWENVDTGLNRLAQALSDIHKFLHDNDSPGSAPEPKESEGDEPVEPAVDQASLISEVSSLQGNIEVLKDRLASVISQEDVSQIHWLHLDKNRDILSLHSAPLEVGPLLKEKLFNDKESVVLTSATLRTQKTFDYIRRRLDLPQDMVEKSVKSPFDYEKAALLMLPEDMPQPNNEGYVAAISNALVDLGGRLSGHTMALFTSYATLRNVEKQIRSRLNEQGVSVLAQGIDGSAPRIKQRFVDNPKAVLLGTNSFWEGVDFPGGVMRALVITKLPFQVPTDPIVKARSDQYQNAFNDYSIPHAALRFRQGIGRLIRSKGDSGVIVVLDKRITASNYGHAFQNSIPSCTFKPSRISSLGSFAAQWIEEADRGTGR